MPETMQPLGGMDWRALLARLLVGQPSYPFAPAGGPGTPLGATMAMPGVTQAQVPAPPTVLGYLPEGRPIVRNPDGSVSTHRNIGVGLGDQEFLLPTMYGGGQVSPDTAVDIARRTRGMDPETGQPFPRFQSPGELEDYESRAHDALVQRLQQMRLMPQRPLGMPQ